MLSVAIPSSGARSSPNVRLKKTRGSLRSEIKKGDWWRSFKASSSGLRPARKYQGASPALTVSRAGKWCRSGWGVHARFWSEQKVGTHWCTAVCCHLTGCGSRPSALSTWFMGQSVMKCSIKLPGFSVSRCYDKTKPQNKHLLSSHEYYSLGNYRSDRGARPQCCPHHPWPLWGKKSKFFIKMKLIFLCFLLVYCGVSEVKGEVSEIESAPSFSAQRVKTVLINGHCLFLHAEWCKDPVSYHHLLRECVPSIPRPNGQAMAGGTYFTCPGKMGQ